MSPRRFPFRSSSRSIFPSCHFLLENTLSPFASFPQRWCNPGFISLCTEIYSVGLWQLEFLQKRTNRKNSGLCVFFKVLFPGWTWKNFGIFVLSIKIIEGRIDVLFSCFAFNRKTGVSHLPKQQSPPHACRCPEETEGPIR